MHLSDASRIERRLIKFHRRPCLRHHWQHNATPQMSAPIRARTAKPPTAPRTSTEARDSARKPPTSRNPVVAKKFFVVPRMMFRSPACQCTLTARAGPGDARAEPASFTSFPSFHIVHHFHRQPPVRSHLFVSAAPDQLKRAHAHIARWISDCSRATAARPAGRPSRKTSSRSSRPTRTSWRGTAASSGPNVFLPPARSSAARHVGLEMDVRIREHQPLARRMFERLLQRMRLAEPSGGKGIHVHHFQLRISARRRV